MPTTHVTVGALFLCALILTASPAGAADELPRVAAPIDRGSGTTLPRSLARQAAPGTLGGPDAHLKGAFGPPVPWPIVGIHGALLPDGRLLSFGTDERGQQGGRLVYDIWDPALGTGNDAHLVLPNTTLTDIFCSGQTLLATTGEVIMTGGNTAYGGKYNRSLNHFSLFRPTANSMVAGKPMAYRRWYPTTLALANGAVLVLGGREDHGDPATVPEILSPSGTWRALPGAASEAAFGSGATPDSGPWFYPRAVVTRNGVFVLGHDGAIFQVSTTGLGRTTKLAASLPAGGPSLPMASFAPGKVLALRFGQQATVVDLTGTTPKVTPTGRFGQFRALANATVLADGKVAVTGGSRVYNQLVDVAYAVEIWDPATGRWTLGAAAQKPRLYHATALLLPDATLLTMGGGAPGPVTNLNAEIYYPPYLFAGDGSGSLAPRPTIVAAPATLKLGAGFEVAVGPGTEVGRVTLVRHGSATHGLNVDQRFIELAFTQSGSRLAVTAPADAWTAVPGYYMLFVLDRAGVPSVAKIVKVPVPG